MKEGIGIGIQEKAKGAYSIDRVNPLSPFISFTLYPVSIEIGEKTVDIIRASRIAIPLFSIITQKCLILEGIGLLDEIALISDQARYKTDISYISKTFEMRDEVPNEIVIQIRAHQVRAR
jgi:hypothetical protein